jgi:UDP-N-acetylglucosamine--N-acetylmuramyl-(pentapeptide) pyrophosphoryl-undecaprenol N-acetylglucosamine transferase
MSEHQVLWVGSEGGMEAELVQRHGVSFTSIPAAGVHGVGLRALPGNALQLLKGWLAARKVIKQFNPDVLLFTGGYIGVPVAVAGRHVPSLLFVPDIEPGLALKFLSRFARRIAVTTEQSLQYFANRPDVIKTGYPTRPDLKAWQADSARKELGLRADQPVLLIFGGSQGARSINHALFPILPALLGRFQVIHISGPKNWSEVEEERNRMQPGLVDNYHSYPYLHEEMGAALSAADLVISRAGASSLGEFPLFGLPAILVPYPYAWRYQQVNAEYLASKGAAVIVKDEDLREKLLPTVLDIFSQNGKLDSMRSAMQQLATPDAAEHIARLVMDLAHKGRKLQYGGSA